ncbi:MAG TPA: CehA/McbA family metallohydrolase [Bryobacteraceae bacterium]|nr:CehA/McbA family metallohydrolase [Bryobacteraceae bacterium]
MRRKLALAAAMAGTLFWLRSLRSQSPAAESRTGGYRSMARYLTEEDAIRKGEQMGLGEASLDGPSEAVVDRDVPLKLRFRVGRAGMKTGGGLRLATAHGMGTDWGGLHLQTSDPAGENYLAFRTSTGAALAWRAYTTTLNPLFARYHPWQFINEFKLTGPSLKEGNSIEIDLGGSRGVRMQSYDEKAFVFRFYVDALGNDDYLPLERNPHIRLRAAPAAALNVVTPSGAEAGRATWVNVWADDGYGNPADSFRGKVAFSSEAGDARLPGEYTFQSADQGAHRFEQVIFPKPGTYRIRVRSADGTLACESNPVIVRTSAARERIYWGDIHTHTMYSDGRGTPEETYDFGRRVAALDFTAVTDHSFLVEDWMWEDIKATANRLYQPGRFVTFLAYEWSGQTDVGGDHNVYTTDSDMPVIRCYSYFNYQNLRMYHGPNKGANHVEDLFRMLAPMERNENLMVIPHYGGRQANPAFHNPGLQRAIEIFSDHRRSEDWATKFLQNGYRLGVIASTDNHAGNAGYGVRRAAVTRGEEGEVFSRTSPAERGTALVAVYAGELTRQGIFQGLYHRRTYATTGTRIILNFEINGSPMGSQLRVSGAPRIVASAEGTAPIQVLRVVKNGKVVHAVSPGGTSASLEYVDASGDYQNVFYYIDLVQTDGKKAISSPIWVN